MFQLKKEEIPEDFLKSQIVTLNESGNKRGLHIKKCHTHLLNKVYICLLQF